MVLRLSSLHSLKSTSFGGWNAAAGIPLSCALENTEASINTVFEPLLTGNKSPDSLLTDPSHGNGKDHRKPTDEVAKTIILEKAWLLWF